MTEEQKARRQIDARIHGMRVRLGRARAKAQRAESLTEKIALYSRAKELERELASFQKRYWAEVAKLELEARHEAQSSLERSYV